MAARLIVTVANVESGRIGETRVFHACPVTVGSSGESALRLVDRRVAPQQGLLFFTSASITYLDCSRLGGETVEPPEVVELRSSRAIGIGPFEISAYVDEGSDTVPIPRMGGPGSEAELSFLVQEVGRVFTTVGLTSQAFCGRDARAFLDFMIRALKVLDIVAAIVLELKRGLDGRWRETRAAAASASAAASAPAGPAEPDPSWDPVEIAYYLIDREIPDGWLDELRSYFIDLVHRQASLLAPIAKA
jgi:hypothetical protein